MNPILKNILAVVVGVIAGGFVNGMLISFSSSVIALPEGVDPNQMESVVENMHRFEAKHFLMPFLAHAIGTLVGAYLAALIAASHKSKFGYAIGGLFLVGGIINVVLLPAPLWFSAVDLVFAYLPMAYLGIRIATRK
jgi:hypothetical protein